MNTSIPSRRHRGNPMGPARLPRPRTPIPGVRGLLECGGNATAFRGARRTPGTAAVIAAIAPDVYSYKAHAVVAHGGGLAAPGSGLPHPAKAASLPPHSKAAAPPGRWHRALACCVVLAGMALFPVPRAAADPPAGSYADWLQTNFPGAYPDPLKEATVWGDLADPDGDGCGNLIEFMMARDPQVPDNHLGARCRIEGDDFVITYRQTTATGHGVALLGEWSTDIAFWVKPGVRYQVIGDPQPSYRLVEARISRNREARMFFRLAASR